MASHVAREGKSVEAKGRTVDLAIEEALTRLDCSQDQVKVQVLREASRGLFGIGAQDAIVRVTKLIRTHTTGIAAVSPSPMVEQEIHHNGSEAQANEADEQEVSQSLVPEPEQEEITSPEESLSQEQLLALSREILLDILERMNIIADVQANWSEAEDERDQPTVVLDIIGDDLGLLIGRGGDTLRDLQYLMRLIVGRKLQGWTNLVVDVEGYKQRRERTIRQSARRVAKRVVESNRPAHLEPMNSYERRLVHLELSKLKGIKTKSSGEGEHRKVGIYPA